MAASSAVPVTIAGSRSCHFSSPPSSSPTAHGCLTPGRGPGGPWWRSPSRGPTRRASTSWRTGRRRWS